MARPEIWTDLLDPTEPELRRGLPAGLSGAALERLLAPHDERIRPTFQGQRDYVFGVLLNAFPVPDADKVLYQEVDLVVTRDAVLTVRKTPPGQPAFDLAPVEEACGVRTHGPGMVAYRIVDEIAERYLDLLDTIMDEIDELEAHVADWPPVRVYGRLSELRHDLLRVRHTLAPTRDALRAVAEGRVDIGAGRPFSREVFPREVEARFAAAHDKLLRATEGLELARDLLAAVRDYHQSQIATAQNEVVKRLTAVASLLLFPTFFVGVYGQNFEHMPELDWKLGYPFSWAVIAAVTIGQLVFFRRKGWI